VGAWYRVVFPGTHAAPAVVCEGSTIKVWMILANNDQNESASMYV